MWLFISGDFRVSRLSGLPIKLLFPCGVSLAAFEDEASAAIAAGYLAICSHFEEDEGVTERAAAAITADFVLCREFDLMF